MKVKDAIKPGETTLSFEFFPPKTAEQESRLFSALDELRIYNPDFASITCGAMGSNRDKTLEWARIIKQHGIEPIVHLTCVAETKAKILIQLQEIKRLGIENILALRGDLPKEERGRERHEEEFKYAAELVAFIKKQAPEFCLGVAGYPEKHPQAASFSDDISYLKSKIDAGADYIITQLFFNNRLFFDFVVKCRQAGITIPIIPGVMIITSLKQIQKMTEMCGANIPDKLLAKIELAGDQAAVEAIGVEHAISQCRELLKNKVPGLHFFVMNQSGPVGRVISALRI
ncbi:methylenetetrahydrofolate reductase [NAD(P)H] [Candidatus Saganbacteria bacterium]|nr:methylenetetrahydrofolate reductase [NAD(P)H] [Candidatus Saganbacteria bacterium]